MTATTGAAGAEAGATRISEHLANERTHLAWVRTAIALISFGITINRFSLYLIETRRLPEPRQAQAPLLDLGELGVGLALFGMGLLGWAGYRYERVDRAIDRGIYHPARRAMRVITLVVLALGAGMLFLLFRR
jgi:putative membrane protein